MTSASALGNAGTKVRGHNSARKEKDTNKQRRKATNEIITKIENLMDVLEAIRGEEEEYLENIPENLQGSERYEIAEEAIENLEEALTCLEDSLDYMEAAIG